MKLGYGSPGINGRCSDKASRSGSGKGKRILFHVLNASAGEIRSLALPGHVFRIVALDGNPVPRPADVPVLWLGTAERISAIGRSSRPGVWVLGDLSDDDRGHGMGIVVEYAAPRASRSGAGPDRSNGITHNSVRQLRLCHRTRRSR